MKILERKTQPSLALMGFVLFIGLTLTSCADSAGSASVGQAPGAEEWAAAELKPGDNWYQLRRRPVNIPPGSDAAADLSRNIYIILDGSGSMSEKVGKDCGANERFERKIDGARWALSEFLKSVPDDINLGLYLFDRQGPREVMPLARLNREGFRQQIEAISVGGTTPLATAMRFASDRLNEQYVKQLGYGEYRLVIITDGLAEAIPKAAIYAAERGVPIYAIGLCIGADHPLRQYSVSYQAVDKFTDLQKSLGATLAELPDYDAAEFSKQENK